MSRYLLFFFLGFSFLTLMAVAEEKKATILRGEQELTFQPQEALFVLYDAHSGEYSIRDGFLIDEAQVSFPKSVVALLKQTTDPALPMLLQYRVLFHSGETGDFALSELYTIDDHEDSSSFPSQKQLKDQVVEKQKLLERLEAQNREKEKALERLRKDLSIIGYFNKATELEQETHALERQIESANEQQKLFYEFISTVKKDKPPAQFTLRKQELAKFTAEVRKKVQEQQEQRVDYTSSQFLADLNLVEQTQNEDLDKLRDELIELRKARQARETQQGVQETPLSPPLSAPPGFRSFRSPPIVPGSGSSPTPTTQNET